MAGCILAVLAYVPIYAAMQSTIPVISELGAPATMSIDKVTDPVTRKETDTRVEGWMIDSVKVTRKTTIEPGSAAADNMGLAKIGEKPKIEVTPTIAIFWTLVGLVFIQVFLVTMVYGPIAAFLVELFPTRIRYTSMSLPYHIGNGVFGGLVPFIGTLLVDKTGNKFAGLWYPMTIAFMTFVIGSLLIKERRTQEGFAEQT